MPVLFDNAYEFKIGKGVHFRGRRCVHYRYGHFGVGGAEAEILKDDGIKARVINISTLPLTRKLY